jgi:hypothetical protein
MTRFAILPGVSSGVTLGVQPSQPKLLRRSRLGRSALNGRRWGEAGRDLPAPRPDGRIAIALHPEVRGPSVVIVHPVQERGSDQADKCSSPVGPWAGVGFDVRRWALGVRRSGVAGAQGGGG